jgi:hypothetical protein
MTDSQEKEMQVLRDKLTMRETEIQQMRDSDAQRASMLQAAIQNYIAKPYNAAH